MTLRSSRAYNISKQREIKESRLTNSASRVSGTRSSGSDSFSLSAHSMTMTNLTYKTTISQSCVAFLLQNVLDGESELLHAFLELVFQSKIQELPKMSKRNSIG